MQKININYTLIFRDILEKKYSWKREAILPLLECPNLSAIEIIHINRQIFGINEEAEFSSHRHRSYSKSDIFEILDYQKKHQLNNSQLANHFKISRNSISKWKKYFC